MVRDRQKKRWGSFTSLEIQLSGCSKRFCLRGKKVCVAEMARRGQIRLWAGKVCCLDAGRGLFPLLLSSYQPETETKNHCFRQQEA